MLKDTILTKDQEHELEEIKKKIHEDSIELNNIKTFVNQKREELSVDLGKLIQQCQTLEVYVYNTKKKSIRAKTINWVNVAYV